jgi:tubulin monoglycylase TTLL3/8
MQKESQYIAQKYIENPLLVKSRKFDLRVWVVVTDWNPLTIWYFRKPYVRLPAHDYDVTDLENNYAHLANNSIARHDDGTKKTEYKIEGNMMFVEDFQEYLSNIYASDVYEEQIEERLKNVVINTLESVQDTFEYKKGCFELYGFDIMVDTDFNCWLIEVNSSPAMDYSTHVTEKLVKTCLEDVCKVLVDREAKRTAKGKAAVDTGEFELIYQAKRVVEKPLNTFGLNLAVAGSKIPEKLLPKW